MAPRDIDFVEELWRDVLLQLAVVDTESQQFRGIVVAYRPDLRNGHLWFAVLLSPAEHGRDLIVEAVPLFLGHLFKCFPVRKIYFEAPEYAISRYDYATPGRRGGYAIDVQHTLPPLNLSAAEVAAVATALAADAATPFTHAGRRALQKILAVLGEVDAEGVRELASRIRLFDHADGQSRPSAVVERAIVAQQVLDITYRDKAGDASTRAVEPVAVLGVRPHWYLWAWCRLRQEPRSFRLDRITDAVMTDEAVPDRGLDPANLELTELVGRGILGG